MMLLSIFIVIFIGATFSSGNSLISSREAQNYLEQYGYLGSSSSSYQLSSPARPVRVWSRHALRASIMFFQRHNGLQVTGYINAATTRLMNTPRCGNKDIQITTNRGKRYAAVGKRWPTNTLRYKITQYPSDDLHRDVVHREIQRAFQLWSDVTPLRFIRVSYDPNAEIIIKFASGDHCRGGDFDGKGGVLAHAFVPVDDHDGLTGDIHFDDDERWAYCPRGTNLLYVAAHEMGHSLGLDHSTVKEAIMYPYYPGYKKNYRLHSDDIQGIRHLYGSNAG